MRTKIDRPVSHEEAEVIRVTLQHVAAALNLKGLEATIAELQVSGKCDCGCDSIDFVEHGDMSDSKPIADGIGNTVRDGKVGVIVWGTSDMITGLEVYDLGAGDHDIRLPIPESIESFERSTP